MSYGVIGYSASVPSSGFFPVSIDGGGFVTGLSIAPDGTMLSRVDVFGANMRSTSLSPVTTWRRLLNITSMPAGIVGFDGSGNWKVPAGVYEIVFAPSNTNILYMMYKGQLFKSTDRGVSWTNLSNFSSTIASGWSSDENTGIVRYAQKKMAVHPTDPNTVIIGTPANGAYYTTDGGANFTQITGIPNPTSRGCVTGICFDPATPTKIYAASNGNGVYGSTTGASGAWAAVGSGSPTAVTDALFTNGNYFCTINANKGIVQFIGGTWTTVNITAGGPYQSITVDPANSNHIVASPFSAAELTQTNDGGTNWFKATYTNGTTAAGDVPWLAQKNPPGGNMAMSAIRFDPSVSNRIWMSNGNGVFYCDGAASATGAPTEPVTWVPVTAGIQNLVGKVAISPPGFATVLSCEDCAEFVLGNPAVNPSTFGISNQGNEQAGFSIDYAKSSPSVVAAWNDFFTNSDGTTSGIFLPTPSVYAHFPTDGMTGVVSGGCIAAATPLNQVALAYGQTNPIVYTNDAGATAWKTDASGLPSFGWPSVTLWSNNIQILCCDAAGTYFAYCPLSNTTASGLYSSTDGGKTWTQVSSTNLTAGGFFYPTLKPVPGIAQFVVFTPGGDLGNPHPTTAVLSYSVNAGPSMTWNSVPNVKDCWSIGFGQAAPGHTNPSTWMVGFVNNGHDVHGNLLSGYNFGIWVSKDFTTTPASATWTFLTKYPFDSYDKIVDITGDMNDWTKCYFCFQGSGFGYGRSLTY